jgi:hypothetical protein
VKQSLSEGKNSRLFFCGGVSASDITLLFVCNVFASLFVMILDHKALVALLGAGFLLLTGLYTFYSLKKLRFLLLMQTTNPLIEKEIMLAC